MNLKIILNSFTIARKVCQCLHLYVFLADWDSVCRFLSDGCVSGGLCRFVSFALWRMCAGEGQFFRGRGITILPRYNPKLQWLLLAIILLSDSHYPNSYEWLNFTLNNSYCRLFLNTTLATSDNAWKEGEETFRPPDRDSIHFEERSRTGKNCVKIQRQALFPSTLALGKFQGKRKY